MELKIINKLYVLSYVFNHKDPFIEDELKEILSQYDYKINKTFNFESDRISVKNMKIAEINKCDIVYNSANGALFIAGKERENVNTEFPKLGEILTKELKIHMDQILRTVELISDNQITTDTEMKPIDVINKYYENCDINQFNDIFGHDNSSYFVIRIVPQEKHPKSNKWYDLLIEPASTRSYRLRLVYRDHDIQKVMNFAQNLEEKINDIMKVVEGA